jgi:superfamily I DNA/RNA helicase
MAALLSGSGFWVEALKELFADYVEAKQQQSILDYDDLLLYWVQMMSDTSLLAEIGSRFDHVPVDEYQDANRLQAAIARLCAHGARRRRTIYSFSARDHTQISSTSLDS